MTACSYRWGQSVRSPPSPTLPGGAEGGCGVSSLSTFPTLQPPHLCAYSAASLKPQAPFTDLYIPVALHRVWPQECLEQAATRHS